MQANKEARILLPYLLPMLEKAMRGWIGGSGGGGGITPGAPTPHALSSSHHTGLLLNAQAPQFLLLDGSRQITGNVTMAVGKTIDGVDIDVHAANPSAHHAPVTVGDGLDLSGQLVSVDTNDIVDTAFGLSVNSNNIRIALATNSGLTFTAGLLHLGTPSTLSATSTSGVTSTNHSHAVTASNDVGTTPAEALLKSTTGGLLTLAGLTLKGDLAFSGATARTITAASHLYVQPTGDLWLNPISNLVQANNDTELRSQTIGDIPAGISGWRISDRGGNQSQLTITAIKADEMIVRFFTADETRVQRGETYLTKSYGTLETAFVVPADEATVDVWFEGVPGLQGFDIFDAGDWLLSRPIDLDNGGLLAQAIWWEVVTWLADNTTAEGMERQQWRIKRKSGGVTGTTIHASTVFLDAGIPTAGAVLGSGWIHSNALKDAGGPYIQVGVFDDIVLDVPQFVNHVRMGNLDGTVDYTAAAWGIAAGSNLGTTPSGGFSGFAADAEAGLRLFNTEIQMYAAGVLGLKVSLADGIAMQQDTAAEANDLRTIAWYDDVAAKTGKRAALYSYTSGFNSNVGLYSSGEGSGQTANVTILAVQDTPFQTATITLASENVPATGSLVTIAADFVYLLGKTGVGTANAVSTLHVYENTSAVNQTAGALIQQNGSGDAVLHWMLTTGTVYYTAGIDQTDGKWKVSAGTTLGSSDFIVIDPGTGSVTITGLSGGSVISGLTGGDGITLAGVDIAVDATVARSTVVLTAGAGLSGGGDLSLSRTFDVGAGDGITVNANDVAVDSTVVRTSRNLVAGNGLTGGGSLAADRTFDIGAGDGITVNANDIAVNSTVVRTTRTVATNGALSGGGALSSNLTLSLSLATNSGLNQTSGLAVDSSLAGAGLLLTSGVINVVALSTGGLTANANDLQIKLPSTSGLTTDATGLYVLRPANSGLTMDATGLYIASGFAGAGMTMTSGVINVIAANGSLTVNANDMNVNLAHTFAWTGAQTFAGNVTWNTGVFTFNTDPQLAANLDFISGARSITTASTDNLTLAPGGDLILSPGGFDVLPGGSMTTDLGDYNRKWLTLYAAELYVETLVAQDVMATIGGRILVAPTTTLVADMTNVQTTINVKHNNLVNGSYIRLQTAPAGVAQVEVMKVTSAVSGTAGNYTYTVTRNLDGSGANAWVSGDAVVDIGSAVGDGYIELTSTNTIHSHVGPNITIYSRTATTLWNDTKAVVSMGNLSSFVDYSGDEFGFAVGNDLTLDASTGFSGLTADRTNGVRLFNTALQLYNGSNLVASFDKTNGIAMEYGNNSYNTVSWHNDLATSYANPMGHIGLERSSAPYSVLSVISEGQGATYTTGAVHLRAEHTSSADYNLFLDTTGVYIGPGTLYPSGEFAFLVGGKFGAGTDAPITVGHFYQSNASVTTDTGVLIEQGSTGDAVLRWKLAAASVTWSAGLDNSNSDRWAIGPGADLSGTPVMVLDGANFRMGLGTTAPSTTLHIDGNSLWVKGTGSSGLAAGAGSGIRISSTNIFSYDYATGTPNTLTLQSPGGTVAITGAASVGGKLGIGTTAPTPQVEISGSDGNLVPGQNVNAALRIDNTNSSVFGTGSEIQFSVLGREPGAAISSLYTSWVSGGAVMGQDLVFSTTSASVALVAPSERMRITRNGSVGIGTASPSTMLHVAGVITATGINVGEDDLTLYDEGTWSPVITASTTSPTYVGTGLVGTYTRINNLVIFRAKIGITSISVAGAGTLRFSLPIASAAGGAQTCGSAYLFGINAIAEDGGACGTNGVAYCTIVSGATGLLTTAHLGAGDVITYSGSYYV